MIVAIQSMGVLRLYYARETCYHKSNGGFAADAEKAARRREKNAGDASTYLCWKMQPTNSLLLEAKVGGFSRSDEV